MVYAAWHLGERTLYDTFDTSRMTQSSSTHALEEELVREHNQHFCGGNHAGCEKKCPKK